MHLGRPGRTGVASRISGASGTLAAIAVVHCMFGSETENDGRALHSSKTKHEVEHTRTWTSKLLVTCSFLGTKCIQDTCVIPMCGR